MYTKGAASFHGRGSVVRSLIVVLIGSVFAGCASSAGHSADASGGGAGGDSPGGAGGSGGAGGGAGAGVDASPRDTNNAADVGAGRDAGVDAMSTSDAAGDASTPAGAVVWAIDNLKTIGGHAATVLGNPTVIDTPQGKAVQFDGAGDALLLDSHPLAGLSQFTVEIVFRPDANGAFEQRFFHMQETTSENRVLFETRVMNGRFFLDVVLQWAGGSVLLYVENKLHPGDQWYAVAVTVDGTRAHTYVNGVEQTVANVPFRPLQSGRTSIGVRITRTSFFKGAMRLARFTPRALAPAELLGPDAAP